MCQLYRFMLLVVMDIALHLTMADSTKNTKSDVVHCFSDPFREEVYTQHYQECPLESFKHGGRCRNAYIDHYKEMVMDEIGTTRNPAVALSKEVMSEMKQVHQIPRKAAVCVDFDEQCYCKWINIHEGVCHRLKPKSVLLAGDSMLRKQLEAINRICPEEQALYSAVGSDYFNPAHREDSEKLEKALMNNKDIEVLYIGFALHSINEFDRKNPEYADLWMNYESYIARVIETAKRLRPGVQIVWLIPNSIICTRWNGKYREDFDAVLMNSVLSKHGAEDMISNDNFKEWEYFVERSFTRRSVVALARRSERVLHERFPEVHVISGIQITDFMERYTFPQDGRHFYPFVNLKLSILYTLNQERLLTPAV